jgi:hypothetical protein
MVAPVRERTGAFSGAPTQLPLVVAVVHVSEIFFTFKTLNFGDGEAPEDIVESEAELRVPCL